MSISTHILPGPLPPEPVAWQSPPGAGAVVRFEGVARPREGDRAIDALDYEAYEPMLRERSGAWPSESVRSTVFWGSAWSTVPGAWRWGSVRFGYAWPGRTGARPWRPWGSSSIN